MKIILIEKTKGKGGFQARVYGENPVVQSFAKTEVEALIRLAVKIKQLVH